MDTKMIYWYIIDKTIRETKKIRRWKMSSVLKVDNIEKYYGSKANLTKAIDRISFEVEEGEYIGIMGLPEVGRRHY